MHIVSCVPFPSCHFFCLFHSTILYLKVKLIYSFISFYQSRLFLILDNFFLSVSIYTMKFQASSLMYIFSELLNKYSLDLSLTCFIIIICHLVYHCMDFYLFIFYFDFPVVLLEVVQLGVTKSI